MVGLVGPLGMISEWELMNGERKDGRMGLGVTRGKGYTGVMHSKEKATGLHGKGNAGLNIPSKPQLNPASQGCTVTG